MYLKHYYPEEPNFPEMFQKCCILTCLASLTSVFEGQAIVKELTDKIFRLSD